MKVNSKDNALAKAARILPTDFVLAVEKHYYYSEVHTYNELTKNNSQHDLQNLCKGIMDNGEVVETIHHGYSHYEPGKDSIFVENGSICYVVHSKVFPMVEYFIHMTGFKVDEIVEIIKKEYK